MRITSFMIFNQLTRALQSNMEDFTKLNSQLASGKRIQKPSDDIIGMMRALDYRLSINTTEQYKKNIEEADFQLQFTDNVLGSLSNSLLELKQLVSTGGNAQSQENRSFYAEQAAKWRDFLLGLSNTKLREKYIFSGYQTNQKAFTYNSTTYQYEYNGDLGEINVLIDKEATLSLNIQGSRAFSFTMNGPLPTELPDGTPINYTQSTDPSTGITTTTVEIGNAGDPEYDTFSFSNVMDMANVLSFAFEYKNVDGSDLNADPDIQEEMALHRIAALSIPFDDASNQVLNVRAEIGTRQVYLNDQKTRIDSSVLNLTNALSETEDADMDKTATEILKTQTALDALRQSASRIISQSLIDFLQQ
jgi:flagellar hook-associated protein 3 FlgL